MIYKLIFLILSIAIFYKLYSPNDIKKFRNNGYYVFKNIISKETCDKILEKINIDVKDKSNFHKRNFLDSKKGKRIDLLLDIEGIYKDTFIKIHNLIKPVITKYFRNNHYKLYEFSAMITYPKSSDQNWHRDGYKPYYRNNEIVSFALLLDDVDESKSPTQIYKGSHLTSYVKSNNLVSLTGKKGDLIAWDTHAIHRGSANLSNKNKTVFLFTLLNSNSNESKNKKLKSAIKSKYNNISIKDIV